MPNAVDEYLIIFTRMVPSHSKTIDRAKYGLDHGPALLTFSIMDLRIITRATKRNRDNNETTTSSFHPIPPTTQTLPPPPPPVRSSSASIIAEKRTRYFEYRVVENAGLCKED